MDIFGLPKTVGIADDRKVRLVIKDLPLTEKLWLLETSGEIAPNYQIMYGVGPKVFLNTFNQQLSVFTLTGLYVSDVCGETINASSEPVFMQFYKTHNIVVSDTPISLSYSGIVIIGYIVKLNLKGYRKDGIDGYGFTLQFLGSVQGLQTEGITTTGGKTISSAATSSNLTMSNNKVAYVTPSSPSTALRSVHRSSPLYGGFSKIGT